MVRNLTFRAVYNVAFMKDWAINFDVILRATPFAHHLHVAPTRSDFTFWPEVDLMMEFGTISLRSISVMGSKAPSIKLISARHVMQ